MSVGGAGHPQQGARLSSGLRVGTESASGIKKPTAEGSGQATVDQNAKSAGEGSVQGSVESSVEETFNDFPVEIMPHIFTHLPDTALARSKCVSKEWEELGKREQQDRVSRIAVAFAKTLNEETRSIEDMMKEPTEEQRKCLETLKGLPPNDIGQAIQTLRPKLNKQTGNTAINSILRNAAHTNTIDDVLLALIFGADVNKAYSLGATPLSLAAHDGHTETVKVLLGAGADVNKDSLHKTPALYWAACNGHTETVKALLAVGADINKGSLHQIPPLSSAARRGHTGTVKALLAAGADVNKISSHGTPALYWAAFNGHTEIVKALLEAGAGAGVNEANFAGHTPLSAADLNGHREIVDILKNAVPSS